MRRNDDTILPPSPPLQGADIDLGVVMVICVFAGLYLLGVLTGLWLAG
jgi:hypothetical protein